MDMDIGLDTVMLGHIITLSLTARLEYHDNISISMIIFYMEYMGT